MTNIPLITNLASYDLSPERGFLPAEDPLQALPKPFLQWEQIAKELPKLFVLNKVRRILEQLPLLDSKTLTTDKELRRAMLILSYFGHAYVWGETKPAAQLPASIAIPWYEVASRLGRPPILSYASYALDNWRRLDPKGEIALGNIVLLQNFLAGVDEEWFILVHVDIEAKAGSALSCIPSIQQAVIENNEESLSKNLECIAHSLQQMFQTLCRMPENCDPYIYYNRVRPYIHGWKENPSLPEGVIYEGVTPFAGKGQMFRGETGAQSSIIPAIDALLGVAHKEGPLQTHLMEMRDYMPKKHREFIGVLERGPDVRQYVIEHKHVSSLRDCYNECITWVDRFRSKHLEYAASYIQKQKEHSSSNPTTVGTGGTPFMPYLKKHRDETSNHLVS